MIELRVNDQEIRIANNTIIVSGTSGVYKCHFTFNKSWQGFTKTAIFELLIDSDDVCNATIPVLLDVNDCCDMPESMLHAGYRIRIGVYGIKDDVIMPTTYSNPFFVQRGAVPPEEENVPRELVSAYSQLLVEVIELLERPVLPKNGQNGQFLRSTGNENVGFFDVDMLQVSYDEPSETLCFDYIQ